MRFTIRDVLWLTVVAALLLTWWLDRRSLRSEFASQLQAAEAQRQKIAQELLRIHLLNQIANEEEEVVRRWKELRERPAWDASKAKSQELGAPQPKPLRD
jgi:hypothetical protein